MNFKMYFRIMIGAFIATMFLFSTVKSFAAAPNVGYKFELPLGIQIISNPTVATALVVPLGAKHAMISIRSYGVMYRDDGTAPTTTIGFFYPSGTLVKIDNDRQLLQAMQFINSTDGAAKVYILYYGDR